jgi:hypothetical protein
VGSWGGGSVYVKQVIGILPISDFLSITFHFWFFLGKKEILIIGGTGKLIIWFCTLFG